MGVDALSTILFYKALGWDRDSKRLGISVAALTIAVTPRLVDGPHGGLRFGLVLVSAVLITKFYDLGIALRRPGATRPPLASFLAFLPNIFGMVYRKLDGEPQPSRAVNWKRLAWGIVGASVGVPVAFLVFESDWRGLPLALEHPVKVFAGFGVLMPLDAIGISLWRLAGGRGRQFMRHPYLATTPADFWRRYNRPTGHFFFEDVFRAAGGRTSPRLATLAVFVATAAGHEYLFAAVLGKVEGFQSAFFLIQGLAVAATLKSRPTGWRGGLHRVDSGVQPRDLALLFRQRWRLLFVLCRGTPLLVAAALRTKRHSRRLGAACPDRTGSTMVH